MEDGFALGLGPLDSLVYCCPLGSIRPGALNLQGPGAGVPLSPLSPVVRSGFRAQVTRLRFLVSPLPTVPHGGFGFSRASRAQGLRLGFPSPHPPHGLLVLRRE